MNFPEPSIHGLRVVGVGDTMTFEIPADADVRVLEDHTLICTREGTVHRLVAREGRVVEAPLTTAQRSHVLAIFGR